MGAKAAVGVAVFAAGVILFATAGFAAMRMSALDRQLQQYRRPGAPASKYWFVPLRDRQELYTDDAAPIVARFWHWLLAMYAFGVAGGIVIVIGSALRAS